MDEKYWDCFAHEYDDFVTDPFTYGRNNIITVQIEQVASSNLDAADFGCGPGKMLPLLSKHFHKVYGYDFSNNLLGIARDRCREFNNVEIAWADLSQSVNHLPMVDVAFCLNAAITPDADLRTSFLNGMVSRIRPNGYLFLAVPSIESVLFSAFREMEWQRKKGVARKDAPSKIDISCFTEPILMAQGVMVRGAEPTKHYSKEELIILTREEMALDLIDITKIEYDWAIELEVPSVPCWMRDPYPWDWLVIARQKEKKKLF